MKLSRRISDFFFPRVCKICGGRLSLTEETLCFGCLISLPRTKYHETPTDNYVKNLFELQIPIERAVSFLRYMPATGSAMLIRSLKYGGGDIVAFELGKLVAEEYLAADSQFFDGIDVIVPAPLTSERRKRRGFNQAEMIARGISEVTGLPVDTQSVKRLFFQKSQTMMSTAERRENVRGAFKCEKSEHFTGKLILLVDDVVTTGATLIALAEGIMERNNDVKFCALTIGITGDYKM